MSGRNGDGGELRPDPKYGGTVGDPNWWPYQGPKPTDPNALLMGQQLYGTGLANYLFGGAPDYQPLRPRDPNDNWSANPTSPGQNTSAFAQNPLGDGNTYPPAPPPAAPPGNPGGGRSNPPAPVLNGTPLQNPAMVYQPRGTYLGGSNPLPKPGAAITPPPGGGLLGTGPQQLSGAPWKAGGFSNFRGSYMPAFAPRGVENYQYPSTPGGGVARTSGPGLGALPGNTGAPPGGNGTTVSPDDTKSAALTSGALYQPRTLANYQEAGITMPFRNSFEQYAQSLAMGQPWMPGFSYLSQYQSAPPPLGQKSVGLLGGARNGG